MITCLPFKLECTNFDQKCKTHHLRFLKFWALIDLDLQGKKSKLTPFHKNCPLGNLLCFEKTLWLTHWGRVTHICIGTNTNIGADNGLSPCRRQAIIWTNAGILLIGPLGTNFSEILIGIQTFSFKKMHLKMSSAKWRPFVSASMC